MSNVKVKKIEIAEYWDFDKIHEISKNFNAYVYDTFSKIIGSNVPSNRTLLRPISAAKVDKFMIKLESKKKSADDLELIYTVTSPDGETFISSDAVYKDAASLKTDLDEIDKAFAAIKI